MREMIIIADPNGAGKTSFANAYLPAAKNDLVFVNADEIARELPLSLPPIERNVRAGRVMLQRIENLTKAGAELLFETTLASLSYARKIPAWQARGYNVALIYLRLPDVETSLERVRKRVRAGGHDIPDDIVRRRFARSWEYLSKHYKSIVDEWYVYDSLEGDFRLVDDWES